MTLEEVLKDVKPDYTTGVKISSIDELKTKDPTEKRGKLSIKSEARSGNIAPEGRAADGIVQIKATFEQDSKIRDYASTTANSGKNYNACNFNCSTFAERALQAAFPALDARQSITHISLVMSGLKEVQTTAPNDLYNAAMKLPGATNISGPPSVIALPYLEYRK